MAFNFFKRKKPEVLEVVEAVALAAARDAPLHPRQRKVADPVGIARRCSHARIRHDRQQVLLEDAAVAAVRAVRADLANIRPPADRRL